MQRHRSITKLFLSLFVLLLALSSALPSSAQNAQPPTQPAPPKFAVLEFMKIEPGKNADYRKMEQELWMPIHRERVKAKLIRSWAVCGVRFPGGTDKEYGFMTVQLFDKFEQLEGNPAAASAWMKANPNAKSDEITVQMGAISKTVRSEVLTLLDQVR